MTPEAEAVARDVLHRAMNDLEKAAAESNSSSTNLPAINQNPSAP